MFLYINEEGIFKIIIFSTILFFIIFGISTIIINKRRIENEEREKKELILKTFSYLGIDFSDFKSFFKEKNDYVYVKSRKTLEDYNEISYFKEKRKFSFAKIIIEKKQNIINKFETFLTTNNPFIQDKNYMYLVNKLKYYINKKALFIVEVSYISSANNNLGTKDLEMSLQEIEFIEKNPEKYMSKTEMKDLEKTKLNSQKEEMYNKINSIIDYANDLKEKIIIENKKKILDELVSSLFDKVINTIAKIKTINEVEWIIVNKNIDLINEEILKIYEENKKLSSYYSSFNFSVVKQSCHKLIESQRDFNKYIEEKMQNITTLFGNRIVRNETKYEDSYNYIHQYKKTISPFSVEVSASVFSSAENNPIQYIIKYFYPDKTLYPEQINNLKKLLLEIETLKEAKEIIENYKKEYSQYIENVPSFVLEVDEKGFYKRLGFALIDEDSLSMEYKFIYTSNAGFAQRSFGVPMNEENIIEIIRQLENKLTYKEFAKEQRQLMTPKLRLYIKERDNYTCCSCGNSTYKEPNLLLEIDHICPIAKGGVTIESNLQTLCWKCNRSKSDKFNDLE